MLSIIIFFLLHFIQFLFKYSLLSIFFFPLPLFLRHKCQTQRPLSSTLKASIQSHRCPRSWSTWRHKRVGFLCAGQLELIHDRLLHVQCFRWNISSTILNYPSCCLIVIMQGWYLCAYLPWHGLSLQKWHHLPYFMKGPYWRKIEQIVYLSWLVLKGYVQSVYSMFIWSF